MRVMVLIVMLFTVFTFAFLLATVFGDKSRQKTNIMFAEEPKSRSFFQRLSFIAPFDWFVVFGFSATLVLVFLTAWHLFWKA